MRQAKPPSAGGDAPDRAPVLAHEGPVKDERLPRFIDDGAATKLLVAARSDDDPLVRLCVEFLARPDSLQ